MGGGNHPAARLLLRIPVIVLVLAATAVPVEFQPLGGTAISFKIGKADVAANVAGFVMVGLVFAEWGWLRAIASAAFLSILAESCQLVMMHRVASVIDVVTNVSGAAFGLVAGRFWSVGSTGVVVNRRRGWMAGVLAVALLAGMWMTKALPLNDRGLVSPGILEAHWKFDENDPHRVLDSSGNDLHGSSAHELKRVAGVLGGAVALDGKMDSIHFGRSRAFRLAGSMTVTAWIRSSSYPADDAAIVSSLNHLGFQLDTTIDRGPRGIGFKLYDACGDYMMRYGATPLGLGVWYHVAGVYNAEEKSMDVYLNGQLDNGALYGVITDTQRSSNIPVFVGRRSGREGYEFAGSIDDVRIYSFALTRSQLASVMRGEVVDPSAQRAMERSSRSERLAVYVRKTDVPCGGMTDREDTRLPAAAAAVGVLVAVACIGFRPSGGSLLLVGVATAAGFLLLAGTASNLPSFNLWLIPLTSLAGGASVAVSLRRERSIATGQPII